MWGSTLPEWDTEGWRTMPPTGFPAEAALHGIVEEAPNLLPLSGTPQLTMIGREVPLGSGYADLVAVEGSNRLWNGVEHRCASGAG